MMCKTRPLPTIKQYIQYKMVTALKHLKNHTKEIIKTQSKPDY